VVYTQLIKTFFVMFLIIPLGNQNLYPPPEVQVLEEAQRTVKKNKMNNVNSVSTSHY